MFCCAMGSRPASREQCSTTLWSLAAPRRSVDGSGSGYGAVADSSSSGSSDRIGNDKPPKRYPLTRERVIALFAHLGQPGRRGFGGAADAVEAAALRQATRGDYDLNPG